MLSVFFQGSARSQVHLALLQIWSNCISGFAARCTWRGAPRPAQELQLCLAAESRPAGGVLVYARVLQSTSSFLVPCTVFTTRRRVRPVRLGPHGGREPPRPQKVRYEGLSQVLPVQPLREQVHPNKCCRGRFLIVQHFHQPLNSISPGDIPRRSVRRIPKCSGQSLREVWQHWRRSRGTTCRPTQDQRRAPAWSAWAPCRRPTWPPCLQHHLEPTPAALPPPFNLAPVLLRNSSKR